jgi:hypothetical protein
VRLTIFRMSVNWLHGHAMVTVMHEDYHEHPADSRLAKLEAQVELLVAESRESRAVQ